MKKLKKYLYNHLHVFRRTVQLGTILFLVAIPLFNKFGCHWINGTFYSLSIGSLFIADPAIVLQTILLTKSIYIPLITAIIIPVILALLFGKMFCSWMCPFHLISEWTEKLRRIIRPFEKRKNTNPKQIKYWVVFGIILIFLTITGIPIITLISMPGLISSQIADGLLYKTIGIELLFIAAILTIEVLFAPRFWCKYACPVGGTLALVNTKHTLKISYDPQRCAKCREIKENPCNQVCSLHLNPKSQNIYPFCNNCFECVNTCNEVGCKALKITFKPFIQKTP